MNQLMNIFTKTLLCFALIFVLEGFLIQTRGDSEPTAQSLFDLGQEYHKQGNYERAVYYLKKALERAPNSAIVHAQLGYSLNGQGHYAEAATYFKRSLELGDPDATVLNRLGYSLYKEGSFGQAIGYLIQSIELDPNERDTYDKLVRVCIELINLGQYDLVIESLLRALVLHPSPDREDYFTAGNTEGHRIYAALGEGYLGLGDLESAAKYYAKEYGSASESAGRYHAAAEYADGNGETEKALKYYRIAVMITPDDPNRRKYLASFLEKINRGDEALEHYEAAAIHDVLSPVELGNLGRQYYEYKHYNEAVPHLRRSILISEEKSSVGTFNRLALAYAVVGEYKKALATLNYGLREHPGNDNLRQWLVVISYAADDTRDMDDFSKLDLVHGSTCNTLAKWADEQNILYGALSNYSVCLSALRRLWPKYRGADRDWIEEEATRVLSKIIELYRKVPLKPSLPPTAQQHADAAQAAIRRNDLSQAISSYGAALNIAPWWPAGYFVLALLHGTLYLDEVRALNHMNIYLALEPSGRFAMQAKENIEAWDMRLKGLLSRGAHVSPEGLIITPEEEGW